ncbi:nitrite reductase small subunit NirD [Aromatoleum sp.]|uniref:nitrite reductase small subunit NirD n=1 Tax=Aromatoleum sp. TaxID=2307007 RepID=UPI002FC8443F
MTTLTLIKPAAAAEPGWMSVCALDDIPVLGARVVPSASGDIAVFRTADDEVFAIHDKCPHKGGPLSQGIVHGRDVTCPLHGWKIALASGDALAPDVGCTKSFDVKLVDGLVLLKA